MAKTHQQFVWPIVLIISLYIGYLVLRPFLGVTVLGLLMAFLFYPMYQWFGARIKSSGINVALTTVASFFIIAIPLMLVALITVHQAIDLANDLSNSQLFVGSENLVESVDEVTENLNQRIESVAGIKDAIQEEDVDAFLTTTLPQLARALGDLILGIVSGIPNFFTMLIVYLFVFTAALANGPSLRKTVEELSPFDKKTNKIYIERLGAMAKAMLKGQLLIATLQGIVSAAVLALVGFAGYFWVMAILFTVMSFIPLGAGIITIPLGLILMVTGNVGGGLLVLGNHFIIVTNIDNVIRPMVVPKNAQLPAVLTILAAFGGVAMFGLIGVIYGPMLMIFVTTTIESYLHYKKHLQTT